MTFKLKENQEFIELNKVLQIMNIAQTGGHSKIMIKNEDVFVNGQTETQIRKKLRAGDVVKVDEIEILIK
jgi:ribosome-associated protein